MSSVYITKSVHYVACTNNSLTYGYDDLGLAPSNTNYRLKSLTTDGTDVSIALRESEVEQLAVTVRVDTKAKQIIPLYAEYTDKWYLVIDYLKPYKDTPFATREQEEFTVKVKDYDFSTKTLAIDKVKTLLKMQKMTLANIVEPDKTVSVELTSSSTYTANITYGHASIVSLDYDGNKHEDKVYFSSYVDWCKSFGVDWSILMLNTTKKTYFRTSNEVDREQLYGMFSSATFEEQVSDFNRLFKDVTGDGQMVVYQSKKVVGSDIYKFFDRLSTKTHDMLTGYLGMYLCEVLDDNNKLYYSYFYYVDGSTPNGFISTGGADSFDDDDSAAKNWGDDVGDEAKNAWDEFWAKLDELLKSLEDKGKALLGVVILFLVLWFIIAVSDKANKNSKRKKKK